jgi:hypothetical protein
MLVFVCWMLSFPSQLICDSSCRPFLLISKGLDETDFDAVAGHLVATLVSLEVPQELIDEAVGVVGPLRGIFEKHKEE